MGAVVGADVGFPAGADVAKGLTSSDVAAAAGVGGDGSLDELLDCKARGPRCRDASGAAVAGRDRSGCAGRRQMAPPSQC